MKSIYFECVDSTNKYGKSNIESLSDKTVLYTYNQTDGYGRLDRSWENTPDKNLYLSIILKPFNTPNNIYSNFSQYLSIVIVNLLIKYYGISAKIKWPNDILINNKKVAGILAESTIIGNKFLGLVLGLGINLNSTVSDLKNIDKPATSIFIETGKFINKDDFIKKLYNEFFLLYDRFIEEGFSYIKNDYIKNASFINKTVNINILGTIHSGIAKSITDDGSLILLEDGIENIYFIGDIL